MNLHHHKRTGTDTQVFFPTIYKRILTSGLATSVYVQNLSNQSNRVEFVYKPNCGGSDIPPFYVDLEPSTSPTGNVNHNHRLPGILFGYMDDGWCGSLWVHSLSNLPIDGYVQITNIYEPQNSDTIMVYNAVTRP